MSEINKSRYWWAVLYPENMLPFWEEQIDDILQLPYAYCIHNLDKDSNSEHRKDHIHLIIVFPNTTTYKHAFNTFDKLSASNKHCLNKIEACGNIRYCYNYLIHDTDSCKKNGKYLYNHLLRICGNNFDIGCYEQIGIEEIKAKKLELSDYILEHGCDNFTLFYKLVRLNFDDTYADIVASYSSHFERLCKGNYLLNVYLKKQI